jgi:hypothetical protein
MSPPALFPLIRPAYQDESQIATAKKAASEHPDLEVQLQRQLRFDEPVVAGLKDVSLSEQQVAQLENSLAECAAAASDDPEELLEPVPPIAHVVPSLGSDLKKGSLAGSLNRASAGAEPVEASSQEAQTLLKADPPGDPKTVAAPAAPKEAAEAAVAKEEEEEEEESSRARPTTILVAVSVGLIATIALVAFIVWDQMNTFSGADRVAELLDSADNLTGDEFEAVATTTANLKDWFFLKSDMRSFAVPKEFADTMTLGCRVFKFDGADVGQILAKGDQEVLLFLFRPSDLGVKVHKGKWHVVEGDHWVGGVTAVQDCCFVVAFKGKRSDMEAYLDKKLKR